MANEGMDRRAFLKLGGLVAAASAALPASQLLVTSTMASSGSSKKDSIQYAMTVDLNKCDGCKKCEAACREENNVPNLEAVYGEDAKRYTPYWIRVGEMEQEVSDTDIDARPIPLLCQHCTKPPCVDVCPTKASFRREKDGIVLIDEHRCIGCRYCVIACPFRARTIVFRENPIPPEDQNTKVPAMMLGVATKCTFCAHKDLDAGEKPACVEKCPMGALKFGNRNEKREDVTRMIADGQTLTLRPNMELEPNVFYLGLSKNEGVLEKVLG